MKKKPAKALGHTVFFLAAFIAGLLAAHWITVALTLNNSVNASAAWAGWFDLDREYNVPTLTNAALLGSSALVSIALLVRARTKIQKIGWFLFALLFGYLALDEALIIHEQLAEPTRKLLDISNSNPLYHAWVIPAFFVVIIMALAMYIIRRYFKQLLVFADVLKLVVILAAVVMALEVLGTFVYGNTAAYRYFMVPLEEIFELSIAATIVVSLLRQHVNSKAS